MFFSVTILLSCSSVDSFSVDAAAAGEGRGFPAFSANNSCRENGIGVLYPEILSHFLLALLSSWAACLYGRDAGKVAKLRSIQEFNTYLLHILLTLLRFLEVRSCVVSSDTYEILDIQANSTNNTIKSKIINLIYFYNYYSPYHLPCMPCRAGASTLLSCHK